MRGTTRIVSFALALASPAAAQACGASPGFALIHSALPAPLPEGVYIAEVEIDRSTMKGYHEREGVRARVIRVVQGEPASTLLLRSSFTTSCDSPLLNGSNGLILGLPRGRDGDALVVDPITAHRLDGFRLLDGFQVPAECRDRPCPVEIVPSPTPARARRRR